MSAFAAATAISGFCLTWPNFCSSYSSTFSSGWFSCWFEFPWLYFTLSNRLVSISVFKPGLSASCRCLSAPCAKSAISGSSWLASFSSRFLAATASIGILYDLVMCSSPRSCSGSISGWLDTSLLMPLFKSMELKSTWNDNGFFSSSYPFDLCLAVGGLDVIAPLSSSSIWIGVESGFALFAVPAWDLLAVGSSVLSRIRSLVWFSSFCSFLPCSSFPSFCSFSPFPALSWSSLIFSLSCVYASSSFFSFSSSFYSISTFTKFN